MLTNKRFKDQYQKFIYKNQQTPFSVGTLAVVALCLVALIVATFTQVDISHFWLVKNAAGDWNVKTYSYVAQIPVLIGIVGVLGTRFSLVTVLLYVLIGLLLWPVFALGGGLGYVKTPFFGYILGYFPAVIIAGAFLSKGKTFITVPLAVLCGVLTIHLCGILYTVILGMFKFIDLTSAFKMVLIQTGEKIIYDLVASFLALLVAISMKYVLWIAMDNGSDARRRKRRIKKTLEQSV